MAPYSDLTTFTVVRGADTIAVHVHHPEYEPAAPQPYTGARVNWPGTESTRDALNQSYAEQWATEEIEDERDFPSHVAMILAELAPWWAVR